MKQKGFWSDTSRAGAIVGGASIIASILAMLMHNSTALTMVIAIAKIVVIVILLRNFTLRRAALASESGFSYGAGLCFILAIGLFAGLIEGTYEIFARNFLFNDFYSETLRQTLATLSSTGVYSATQLSQLKEIYNSMFFSPIWVVITTMFGSVLTYGFYGLFVASYTRREANIFSNKE